MQTGGQKILNQLNEDSVSSSENEAQPPSKALALVKEESISEKDYNPVEDEFESELFGPMTSKAIEQARNNNKVKIQDQM